MKYTIKNRIEDLNPEDVFLDKLAHQRAQEGQEQEIKLEVPLRKTNFYLLILLVFVVFGVLLSKTFFLQAKENEFYEKLAENNKYLSFRYSSERGIIYDKNMKRLVENEASFELVFMPQKMNKTLSPEQIINDIASVSNQSREEVVLKMALADQVQFSLPKEEVVVKKNLDHMDLVLFETEKEFFPFLEVRKNIIRKYEPLISLGHILGYLGKISLEEFQAGQGYYITDSIGKTGLELAYESVLREKKGVLQIERTATGQEISRQIVALPQSGDSIVLTLDFGLQQKAEQALQRVLSDVTGNKGVVIALDPRDGGVLSLVSLPGYDNNLFSSGISQSDWEKLINDESNPQLNRALGGVYPTGSAIKPFVGLAALAEGVITKDTTLFCPEKLCIENQFDKTQAECFPDNAFHGWTDIKRAIAESVNPFFYMIAGGYKAPSKNSQFYNPDLPKNFIGLGAKKLTDYLQIFGFASTTGIDLPGEVQGRVPTPEWKEKYFDTKTSRMWYLGDTYNLSIGQGYFLATPLQLASAYAAIANNGKFFQPHILKQTEPSFFEIPINPNYFEIIKQGMRQCVTGGSCTRLYNLPVPVAAKTGTAQVYSKSEIYHNWLAAFAPYENPEIVLLVLVENVEGVRVAAQTIAEDILYWYFTQ